DQGPPTPSPPCWARFTDHLQPSVAATAASASANPKHGVVVGDLLELLSRRAAIDREMSPRARSCLEVAAQDRGPQAGINLCENHILAATVLKHRSAACRADVTHPVRLVPEHRHQIPLAFVLGNHDRERQAPARPTPLDLKPDQPPWSEPSRRGRSVHTIEELGHPVTAAAPIHPSPRNLVHVSHGNASSAPLAAASSHQVTRW